MIKVLNIIGKRPTGGIGSFVYNYQSHFTNKNIRMDYLLFDDVGTGDFDDKVRALGSIVYVLPALKNLRLILLWKKIDDFMRNIGSTYDIIHLHSVNIAFMCFPAAKKYGVKNLISHSHATVYSEKRLNALRNRLLCINLLKQATSYCACSKAAARFLYGDRLLDKVHIFNNAIECKKFRYDEEVRFNFRKVLGLNDKLVMGHVGRFCEQKNQLFLVDVFKSCIEENPNCILLLVGDGPQRQKLSEKIDSLGLSDKVLLLGQRNDVPRLLQCMDVFVLPSIFEGLPVIGIEAQAAGLPMVVSDAVTEELSICNVQFLNLKASKDVWASTILRQGNLKIDRSKCWKEVYMNGYDICKEAQRLEEFYLSLK